MRLALVFDKTRPDTTGCYFERACRALEISYEHWWLRDVSRLPAGYDLYVRIDHGDDYEVRLPLECRPAIFLVIDTHVRQSWKKIRRAARWYDLICCCHREAVKHLRGSEWLPLACDPELHGAGPQELQWDLAFVGNDGGVPRKFYLQALRERYPKSFIGPADYRQLGAIYGRARIGFNYSIANDVNMRIFEVLAAGALLVTNALKKGELAHLGFEEGQHLICYRTPRELLRLIDHFLAHEEERRTIAEQGRRFVLMHHTYRHRVQQLLEKVSRQFGLSGFLPVDSE